MVDLFSRTAQYMRNDSPGLHANKQGSVTSHDMEMDKLTRPFLEGRLPSAASSLTDLKFLVYQVGEHPYFFSSDDMDKITPHFYHHTDCLHPAQEPYRQF